MKQVYLSTCESGKENHHVARPVLVRDRDSRKPAKLNVEPIASDDDLWTLVGAREPGPKRSVLYIGNLNPECTEEKLRAFVEGRAKNIGKDVPKRFSMRKFTTKNGSGNLCARLTVAESDVTLLRATNFWP